MTIQLNSKLNLARNILNEKVGMIATRDGYGKALVDLGKKNKDIVVLCCDLTESTRSNYFQEAYPNRFIEMGIQEQNMAGVAAGMALSGKIPFISSYAVFSPGRNWDQVRVSICYNNANVKIAGAHAGISVGPDGATHQALEDIAITRCLPNMTVLVPCDEQETYKATVAAANMHGPVYIRFARENTAVMTTIKTPFQIGKVEIFKPGKDVSLIACGPLLHQTLLAADQLAHEGINAQVINCHTIKPLDTKNILECVRETRAVVTVEEHQVTGGLYGAITECLAAHFPVPVKAVGMPDSFGESGEPAELLEKYGMTVTNIVQQAKAVIDMKS